MGTWKDKALNEASGMAYCLNGSNRAVVNNDDGSTVHYVDLTTGKTLTKVTVKGHSLVDIESADETAQGTYCLFDIGDNDAARSSVAMYTRGEIKSTDSGSMAFSKYSLKYPGGTPHNAETGMCHPDGSIYVISKVASGVIYKLPESLKTSGTNTMTAIHGPDSDLALVSEAKFQRGTGEWMFVLKKDHNSTIYVWRVSDWTEVGSFSMPAMTKPEAMCIKKDGKGLWVADDAGATGGFYQEVAIPSAYWPAAVAPPMNPCSA